MNHRNVRPTSLTVIINLFLPTILCQHSFLIQIRLAITTTIHLKINQIPNRITYIIRTFLHFIDISAIKIQLKFRSKIKCTRSIRMDTFIASCSKFRQKTRFCSRITTKFIKHRCNRSRISLIPRLIYIHPVNIRNTKHLLTRLCIGFLPSKSMKGDTRKTIRIQLFFQSLQLPSQRNSLLMVIP